MSSATLFRLSGWAAILAGLALLIDTLLIEIFLPEAALTNTVGYLGVVLGLFALIGVYLRDHVGTGRLGGVGFIVNYLGLAVLSGLMFYKNYVAPFLSAEATQALLAGPTKTVFLLSALTFLAGVLLFGAALLRAGTFPQLAVALYMAGFVLFSLEPFLPDALVRAAQVAGAVSIIWFGYTLTSGAPAPQPARLAQPAHT